MNMGLPQGFVKFNSMAHVTLAALLSGDMSMSELTEELGAHEDHVSRALSRLRRHGFIFEAGHNTIFDGFRRVQARYSLKRKKKPEPYKPETPAAQQARYRSLKQTRVPSVFDLLRPISLGEQRKHRGKTAPCATAASP